MDQMAHGEAIQEVVTPMPDGACSNGAVSSDAPLSSTINWSRKLGTPLAIARPSDGPGRFMTLALQRAISSERLISMNSRNAIAPIGKLSAIGRLGRCRKGDSDGSRAKETAAAVRRYSAGAWASALQTPSLVHGRP
jgi:hypothetical protein